MHTTSIDGTTIDFEMVGQGPAIILITGALNYSKFGVVGDLVPLLSRDFTVVNYDRRGRGGSTDNPPYSIDKEIEDVNTLIDIAGGSAHLYGHSAGATLALFTTAELGQKVKSVAAYEPPITYNWWSELPVHALIRQYNHMLAKGKKLEMITQFMRFIGMSSQLIEETLASEHHDLLIDMAPTLAYEAKVMLHARSFLKSQAHHLTQRALLLAGGKSSDAVLEAQKAYASSFPNSSTLVLEGQTHSVEASALAPILIKFFKEN